MLSRGLQAPEPLVLKEQAVTDKLHALGEAVQSGSLTMGDYLARLNESLHRDRRLADALGQLGRRADEEAVCVCQTHHPPTSRAHRF